MADLERTYNVPLRKGVMKAPRYMRANKAVRVLRSFLERHMKTDTVKLGPYLNSKLLERGRKNVPHHVEVKVVKGKDGIARAEYAKAKNLDFLKPKEEKKDEVKLKIPGLGKKTKVEDKKEERIEEHMSKQEEEKKEVLEHPPEKKEKKFAEMHHQDKEAEIKVKEEQVYGRLGSKKTKVKERAKKSKT